MKFFVLVLSALVLFSCGEDESKVLDLRDEVESVLREPQDAGDGNDESVLRGPQDTSKVPQGAGVTPQGAGEWTYEITFISEKNWGYQFFQNGAMMINQTSIPSVQGISGFDSQEKAERTAKHILAKLEKGVFPPTVDRKELDSLKVLRD